MSVVVPFNSDDRAYEFLCSLDGVSYRFDVRWNERAGFWAFDLYLGDSDTLLVAGLPILLGGDILGAYRYLGIGGLFAVDTGAAMQKAFPGCTVPKWATPEGSTTPVMTLESVDNVLVSSDATVDDLGVRVIVVYYTAAELSEAGL